MNVGMGDSGGGRGGGGSGGKWRAPPDNTVQVVRHPADTGDDEVSLCFAHALSQKNY